jgi:glycosyltransferase involved in cell wall biosynthesis
MTSMRPCFMGYEDTKVTPSAVGENGASHKPLLSIVVPLFNEHEVFSALQTRLLELQNQIGTEYRVQVVLVDDGSSDNTWPLVKAFADQHSFVKGVSLSRNFGHQRALFCGYNFADGDIIVSMDGDLQDPPDLIPAMLSEWKNGADIVFAVRRDRHGETLFKRLTAFWFYRLLNRLANISAPLDCGDFRLMSRRALNGLFTMGDKIMYLRGMVGWIGFRTARVEYDRPKRYAGSTKFNLVKMLRFAIDGITCFTSAPLRFSYVIGICATVPFLFYLFLTLFRHFVLGMELASGWTSLLLCIIAFGSMNLFGIGILGEYIAKIFDTVKDRPNFLVQEVCNGEERPVPMPGLVGQQAPRQAQFR